MRLFVAAEIDPTVRAAASAAMQDLRSSPAIRALDPRWVPAENLHVTIRFIGHVDDDRAPSIVEALTAPVAVPPFRMTVGGCGAFPPSGPVRAIWLGLPAGNDALARICDEMNRRLLPFGPAPDARPFRAHLTLARVKDARRGASSDARRVLAAYRAAPVSCTVREAALFQSHLSSRGPRYDAIARVPLIP